MRFLPDPEIIWTSKPPRLFPEPRCHTMMWIGIGSLAIGATSVGLNASGALAPSYQSPPNLNASSQALAQTEAALLPMERGIEAAAQTGGQYTYTLPAGVNPQKYGLGSATGTVNFAGLGAGDVAAANAQKTAANNLALSQKYDPLFIAEALKEQQMADPESAAARQTESRLIQSQIQRPLNSPVTDLLNRQVQESLDAANDHALTAMDQQRLDAAVAQAQADRGGGPAPAANYATPLTTGFAGEARQAGAINNARGWLASGSSPADVAYRREQQNLANLAAEVSGKTPESQFASMSGAQTGPTPTSGNTGQTLALLPANNQQAFAGQQLANWQTANAFNAQQVNPWMAGLSSLTGLLGAAGGALGSGGTSQG